MNQFLPKYSIIIPVYNRPDEVDELLNSFLNQTYQGDYQIVIIEDGSVHSSKSVVDKYTDRLSILYLSKPNTGPGDSRNYGMRHACGNYFIILDSDCIVPPFYLEQVDVFLHRNWVDCFGGADAALSDFTPLQRAINYVMTSFFTTGGLRGSKRGVQRFEPRSFNMGLSKKAFEKTGGFGNIHPGEDPDLVFRLWNSGFKTAFIETAWVYHKRRISWKTFFIQVRKFGQVRAILNQWYRQSRKVIFWLPTVFSIGLILSVLAVFFWRFEGVFIYGSYFILIGTDSTRVNKSVKIGLLSVVALCVQMLGYGYGFLYSTIKLCVSRKPPQRLFPNLFFER